MISLVKNMPDFRDETAEGIRIKSLYECYGDDDSLLFWNQDEGRAFISMADGNMTLYTPDADYEELKEFCEVLSPVSIFGRYDTLCRLGRTPGERINVMSRVCDLETGENGDSLSSKEIYELLSVEGLELPEYPFFAVDFCRRFNRGAAQYFAIKEKCAAVSINAGDLALLQGIASHQKGFGKIALEGIIKKNRGRRLFVCCRDSVKEFYKKSGFSFEYSAGYWMKEK